MTYHKTWFSYVLWVIYTMLCAVFLFFSGNYIWVSYFAGFVPLPGYMALLSGLMAVLAAAALYWIVRGVSGKIRRKYACRDKVFRVIECIAAAMIFAFGIFLRITRALEYIRLQNAAGSNLLSFVNGTDYFDMAKVTSGGSMEPLVYGGAQLYVTCLSFVLAFLGNRVVSAVIFQIFLQIVGLGLAYTAARKSAGRLPACILLLYLACSSAYLEMIKNLGPECLFFDLYLIGMLAAVSYVKSYCTNRLGRFSAWAGAAALGIFIGVLAYLDLTAVMILLVMAGVAVGRKKRPEKESVYHTPIVSAAVIVVALGTCAAGLCGVLGMLSLNRGTDFHDEFTAWVTLHIENTRTVGFSPLYPYSLDMLWFGILAILASFLVFEFFRGGREQNYILWILLCIVAAPTPLAVFGVQPFGLISMYLWGVLAGLGLQNCIFGGKARFVQGMIEEINQAAEEAEKSREAETIDELPKESMPAQQNAEDIDERPVAEAPAEKPRYLENPLPLPKKHVRRQMDYQYEVKEDEMHYDVEVNADDDFDI